MLKMPRMGGPDDLRTLLDDVPAWRHAELLGVSPRTVRRWLAGDTDIPATAFQALFWHTRWGASVIESEYGMAVSYWRLLAQHQAGHIGGKHLAPAANEVAASPRLRVV